MTPHTCAKEKPKESVAHRRESAINGNSNRPEESKKEEENESCSWFPKWGNIVCCCCCCPSPVSEEETLATIELELFLQERKGRYLRWYACSAPEMEGAYAYFQHPLRLEPELDFWLWDNGAAIKEADAKLRARTSMVRFGMISIGRRGAQAPKHQISLIAISQSLSS